MSAPTIPTHRVMEGEGAAWITRTFHLTGAQPKTGLELHRTFQSAGLPAPTLRLDAALGARPDAPAHKMLPETVRSLLPAMERLGIATATEIEVESLGLFGFAMKGLLTMELSSVHRSSEHGRRTKPRQSKGTVTQYRNK